MVKTLTNGSTVQHANGRDTKDRSRGTGRDSRDRSEKPGKQLAIEGAHGRPEMRAVTFEGDVDLHSKPGFIGVGGKWYKRGLLVSILTRHFAYKWQEAQLTCFATILSQSSDRKKRHDNCPCKNKAGHKDPTDYAHAFTQGSKLLKIHDEEFKDDYVNVGKKDFR
jgi:hypothetical protein